MNQPPVDWEKLTAIINDHREEKWGLIPLLQKIQEACGYIPPEAVEKVAEALNLAPSHVQGVISFYAGFTMKPKGRCVLKVCRGTACHVKGSRSILNAMKNELGLEDGQTSGDYQFTLETVACLGACFLAPTMLVNREYYGKLTPNKVNSVIQTYRKEKKDG